MFKEGLLPLYLAFCALAVAAWIALVPGAVSASVPVWLLAGIVALYVVLTLIQRAGQSTPSVAQVLQKAEQLNRARVAVPSRAASGDTR
jgi:hypothetical protein